MDIAGVMTEKQSVRWERVFSVAVWKCALTDVGASSVVGFLFVEQNQK